MKAFILYILFVFFSVTACHSYKINSQENIKTGTISINELKHYKWFNKGYRNYHFNNNWLDSFIGLNNYKITIVGGVWCSDTKMQLPNFIKILNKLKFPMQNLTIIFVDKTKQKPEDYFGSFEKLNIKFVPTFIVYNANNLEIGRIVESPKISLEFDLKRMINLQ